jgi:hypothetical protein
MTEQRRGPTRDQRLVSAALRIGVGIAAAFCAIGALLYFIHHGAEPARYSVLSRRGLRRGRAAWAS